MRSPGAHGFVVTLQRGFGAAIGACLLLSPMTAVGDPCADYTDVRRAHFGDTHVHTSFSQDANWRMGASRATPSDAYRFARGARIKLPPFDERGDSLRSTQLARPLDFAIVTDHAENMDMVRVCSDPDAPEFGAWSCGRNQLLVNALRRIGSWVPGISPLCDESSASCAAATIDVWQDTIKAAADHQDECAFTTFVGYEWSGTLKGANMHRNVIFRGERVPARPISALDAPWVEDLWAQLDQQCRDSVQDCEAITIPHNSNLSGGRMFSALMSDGTSMTPSVAERRSRYERLAEIVQHKGGSECYFAADELCGFEKLPYSSFLGKYVELFREPPANDSRYLREALREGLRLESQLGTNPFTPGFIGSTDTHIGAAGAVEENRYQGNHGAQQIEGDGSLPQLPDRVEQNPGGLAVLYAEENTREALFAAMQRREAYGTSGTRIGLRFFGGRDLPADLCERADMLEQGYALGVPMGGELSTGDVAPVFLASAVQDEGAEDLPGTPLQRIQIIKGWVDEDGGSREQVYEIAGDANNGAAVDIETCEQRGSGFAQLCAVWADPDYTPGQNAYYYARAVENPSCRWQQRICSANGVRCDNPDDVPPAFAGCCDDIAPATLQERAWSSPIWTSGASL